MPQGCSVTVRGKRFPTIKEAAAAVGQSERHAHRHLNRFGHLDMFGLPRPQRERPDRRKAVTIAGETFESMTTAATALGVDRKTIRNAQKSEAARQSLLRAAMAYRHKKGA